MNDRGGNIFLDGVHVSNAKVGIAVEGSAHVVAKNVTFDNVETPWQVDGHGTGSIQGTKITNDPKIGVNAEAASARLGWRRPKGPPLPVQCPSCGSIFPARNNVFGGRYWALWDNEEPCIECGFEHAKLAEGLFNLSGEVSEILAAPDVTIDMLHKLHVIAEKALRKEITPDDAANELDQVKSGLGAVLRTAISLGPIVGFFLTTAISAASLYLAKVAIDRADKQIELQTQANNDKTMEAILSQLQRMGSIKLSPTENDSQQSSRPDQESNRPAQKKAPEKRSPYARKPETRKDAR